MALVITSSANYNETSGTWRVSWSGYAYNLNKVFVRISVLNGVEFGDTLVTYTGNVASIANGYHDFTIDNTIRTSLYDMADGHSLTGLLKVEVQEYTYDTNAFVQGDDVTGNLTIGNRLSSYAMATPTVLNKIDLDLADPTNIAVSWARPLNNDAFFGRFVVAVGNKSDGTSSIWTNVYTSGTYATGASIDVKSSGFDDEIITAMANLSPKDIRVTLTSRFRTGSGVYTDLSTTQSKIIAGAFEYIFLVESDISISPFTIDANLVTNNLPYTITTHFAGVTHTLKLYVNSVLIKTVTGITGSGSFDITSTDLTAMLGATDQVETCNAYVNIETIYDTKTANHNSSSVVATVGAGYVPVITGQTNTEYVTSPAIATLIGKYVKLLSRVEFKTSGNTTGTGTRIKQVKVVFNGQTKQTDYTYASNTTTITNASLITDALASAGTLDAVITLTDFRNRPVTYTFSGIVVLDYFYPKVNSLDVVRCNKLTPFADNALGTFARFYLNIEACSLINSVQKNEVHYRIGYKVSGGASYTYYTLTDVNALTLNGNVVKGTVTTQEFDVAYAYDVVLEVSDVLVSGTPATDVLPYGQVAMMWGLNWVSIGKLYSGVGTLEVGKDSNNISINADGKIQSTTQLESKVATGTAPLVVASATKVTNLNADKVDDKDVGNADGNVPLSNGTVNTNLNADLLDGQHGTYYADIVATGSTAVSYSGFAGTEYYIKFKDGTMIKYGTLTIASLALTTSRGSGAYYTSADLSFTWDTDNPAWTTLPQVEISAKNNTYFTWSMRNIASLTTVQWNLSAVFSVSARAFEMSYRATGRWN